MSNQNPPPQPTDDLATADAQAFLAANELQPDPEATPTNVAAGATFDDIKVTQAVEEAVTARAAYNKPQPWVFYALVSVVTIVLVAISFAIAANPAKTTGSSTLSGGNLSVPTPDSSTTQGLNPQTQQNINTCSQVTNAALGKC